MLILFDLHLSPWQRALFGGGGRAQCWARFLNMSPFCGHAATGDQHSAKSARMTPLSFCLTYLVWTCLGARTGRHRWALVASVVAFLVRILAVAKSKLEGDD